MTTELNREQEALLKPVTSVLLSDDEGNTYPVKVKTKLTLGQIKKLQLDGLFPKNILSMYAGLQNGETQGLDSDFFTNAPYIAYRIANPDGMSQEEFEDAFVFDMQLVSRIYAQLLAGTVNTSGQFGKSFDRVTKKDRKGKKFHAFK